MRRYGYEDSRTRVPAVALGLAVLAAVMLVASGPGYRLGWFSLPTAFALLKWGAYGGIATTVVAVVGLVAAARSGRGGIGPALIALLVALVVVGLPYSLQRKAQRLPRIHDITTDTDNPPSFVAVVPLRASARNPVTYGGARTAVEQHRGYPDLAPLTLPVPPSQAFDRVLATARHMGWELVASDPPSGRIEATDTTFWFGFKDDVVIRVTTSGSGSRVDVRSLSRIGLSDVGTNAARVRTFLDALKRG